MAERFCQLHKAFQWELQAICIPEGLVHHFDIEAAGGHVQRTTRRHVITLQLGRFEAVEVHRTATTADSPCSSPLARLVPKGSAYGYDLIAHVGCETFLRHRTLESVAIEFPRIPFSSLYDMQHKFLFYFGHLHRQSAPILAARPQQRGGGTWLIDGTIEPGTPMYFGIYEAEDSILLDACRIPSENADAITPCLKQLDRSEAAGVEQSLESFREECRQRSEEETDEASRQRHQIVCEHLDRYWGHLFASPDDPCRERTTNTLEALWGGIKRRCRQRQGRKKLTREFRSLPAEFMLISNLESPKYVEVVLDGELGKLAEKLAEAGGTAGPWTTWRSAQQPLNAGRLPQRLIRKDNFLDELTAFYDAHCQEKAA